MKDRDSKITESMLRWKLFLTRPEEVEKEIIIRLANSDFFFGVTNQFKSGLQNRRYNYRLGVMNVIAVDFGLSQRLNTQVWKTLSEGEKLALDRAIDSVFEIYKKISAGSFIEDLKTAERILININRAGTVENLIHSFKSLVDFFGLKEYTFSFEECPIGYIGDVFIADDWYVLDGHWRRGFSKKKIRIAEKNLMAILLDARRPLDYNQTIKMALKLVEVRRELV